MHCEILMFKLTLINGVNFHWEIPHSRINKLTPGSCKRRNNKMILLTLVISLLANVQGKRMFNLPQFEELGSCPELLSSGKWKMKEVDLKCVCSTEVRQSIRLVILGPDIDPPQMFKCLISVSIQCTSFTGDYCHGMTESVKV